MGNRAADLPDWVIVLPECQEASRLRAALYQITARQPAPQGATKSPSLYVFQVIGDQRNDPEYQDALNALFEHNASCPVCRARWNGGGEISPAPAERERLRAACYEAAQNGRNKGE